MDFNVTILLLDDYTRQNKFEVYMYVYNFTRLSA